MPIVREVTHCLRIDDAGGRLRKETVNGRNGTVADLLLVPGRLTILADQPLHQQVRIVRLHQNSIQFRVVTQPVRTR